MKWPVSPGAVSLSTPLTRVGLVQVAPANSDALSRGIGASNTCPAFQVLVPTFFMSIEPVFVSPTTMSIGGALATGQDCFT